ncbi:irregular chiasm C-roughest protein [Drosophila ficusphila]|uniref:irregular chiasm C-roughest protein n=1 Tax=Drosophila ficusphila TaxID=30025 RepID=UPI0007E72808|nr:irregular chiasm C-roughest protein [Drosophila ficusphila]XP_043063371.1 irregular chiasm C-roughest protein [Drosophila ficusphila]XP_043063372.1 irregular chiasm C-roughest protein [Drosophila ficusphila]
MKEMRSSRILALPLVLLLVLLVLLQPTAVHAKSKKNKSGQSPHHGDSASSSSSSSSSSSPSSSSAGSAQGSLEEAKPKSGDGGGQHFAMEPQDQTAVVGSRVTLPCRVMEKVGALQWTKDDFGLGQHRNLSGFERYSMVGSDEEGDFSLDIYPLMLDDDAKYQCQVGPGPQGEQGIRSRFAKLTVLVPPEAPRITQGDYLVTTEDREIELECVSTGGKPAAEITWIDGLGNVLSKGIEYVKEPLADSRRVTARSILKLAPKKEHHNTTFTCQAQNTADRTYRSAKLLLEVKYAPKVAVSVVGGALAGGKIPEGAEVILSCQADANPHELSYRWFVNDELMAGDFTTKMIIHNVTRQYHDALVKCEVANAVGKSEESATLDISFGPVFRQRPVSVEADLGATVSLRCEVAGNPTPEIEWISENSDMVVGREPELKRKVSSETAGRYFCKAVVNGFPEIGAEATVYVKRAPIITSHKVQFGGVGGRVKIDCLAFSIPKAEHILWSFEGKIINMSSADPDIYIFEEHHLPEGVRAALIIRDSRATHFGRYNCTVLNSYGGDSLVITLLREPTSIPLFLVVMGAVFCVALVLMVVMVVVVYRKRRSRKKPMPADVIPEASRGGDKLTELKGELRAKAFDADYSEAGDGLAISLAPAPLPDVQMKGATLGVPLAGPVKFDERFAGDFAGERYSRQCHLKNLRNQQEPAFKGAPPTANGYAHYFEYALDYSPPGGEGASAASVASAASAGASAGGGAKAKGGAMNSATLPHSAAAAAVGGGSNGGGGVASLPRNQRHDLQQSQQANGFLGQPLLQNGIDSRFSAIYGNPYLRTSSSLLPPLPPPSTANPAATPAPPPYHATRHAHNHAHGHNHAHLANGGLKHFAGGAVITTSPVGNPNGAGSGGGGGGGVGGSTPSGPGGVAAGGSVSGSSSNLTASSNTLAATPLTASGGGGVGGAGGGGGGQGGQCAQSPSGQFILSNNGKGHTQKGPLATHV